jgi:hypothetical protein
MCIHDLLCQSTSCTRRTDLENCESEERFASAHKKVAENAGCEPTMLGEILDTLRGPEETGLSHS